MLCPSIVVRAWLFGSALAVGLALQVPAPAAAGPKKAVAAKAKAKPKAEKPAAKKSSRRTPKAASKASGAAPRPVAEQAEAAAQADVVRTEEEKDGVKTYTFGAQEVEGRLRSPQILYFLRRVRAEFDPAPLGHRSFMLELSDTRRHESLR